MQPRVIGLDLSLTATGVALPDGQLATITPDKALRGVDRLHDLLGAVTYITGPYATLAVIEGPAYSRALGAGHHEAAGLWWMVRSMLDTRDIPAAVISPSALKKYATGKGNATKPDMRVALLQRTGEDVRDDNQVDAWWLRAMGLNHLGCPVVEVPKAHRDALAKVDWPEVSGA